MREETAKPTIKLVSHSFLLSFSLFQEMDNVYVIFDNIRLLLDLLKHRSHHLSKEMDVRLESSPRPAMDSKMNIARDYHGPFTVHTSFRQSSATYHTAQFRPLIYSNTPFSAISWPPIGVESVSPILLIVS